MKKRMMALFTIMVMLFIAGCEADFPASPKKQGTDKQKEPSVENTEKGNSKKQSSKDSLVWRVDDGTADSFDTEEGHYYIASEENGEDGETFKTIRYVDYKTKQEIYLCNQPNCKHNNKDCSAVLPQEAVSGEGYLFGDGKYLYLAVTPYDSAGNTVTSDSSAKTDEFISITSEETPPTIYRMNPDGTGREKIYSMDSGYIMEPVFFSDDKYLYTITKKVSEEREGNTSYVTGYDRKLLRIDLKTAKSEEIMDLDNEQTILGVSGRQIIIGFNDYGRKVTVKEMQDDAAYNEILKNSDYIITSRNIDTEEEVELKRYKQKKLHSEKVKNGILYTSYEGKKELSLIDLATNQEKTISTEKSYQIEYILEEGTDISNNGEQSKGKVTIIGQLWDYKEEQWWDYLIDVETGAETKSTLQNRYHTPINIVAENSDSLFVMSDYENATEYVAWMDVYQEYIAKTTYGLISKKDFLNNQAAYKKVEMLGMGEMG